VIPRARVSAASAKTDAGGASNGSVTITFLAIARSAIRITILAWMTPRPRVKKYCSV
jgi:hypothetical protein